MRLLLSKGSQRRWSPAPTFRDDFRILKILKAQCGTGGTREGRTLVIQGDLRERLAGLLEARGFKVKVAGG